MIDFNIQTIMEYLPHRYPFLLVDKVISYEAGKTIKALKNVSVNEPQFTGHFPGKPIMPGVLMLEALAQVAGILTFLTLGSKPDANDLYYFAGVDKARFKRVVKPGDQLILEATMMRQRLGVWTFEVKATVDGELACSAEFLLAISKGGAI